MTNEITPHWIYWDEVPIGEKITIEITNFSNSKLIKHEQYEYLRILATVKKDNKKLYIRKGMIISMDLNNKTLGRKLTRLMTYHNKELAIITFERISQNKAIIHNIK